MFEKYKPQILKFLNGFLAEKKVGLGKINSWGRVTIQKLNHFISLGKNIRGSLILFTEEKITGKISDNGLILASSLELVQAGILIHDDIIDQDEFRRGDKSIHHQFINPDIKNPAQYSISMGICIGDIAFFLAFEVMNNLDIDPKIKQQIIKIFSQEMQTVALAEMQDVFFSNSNILPLENEILDLYKTKTGRYSFSLPLMLGTILTNQSQETVSQLEKLGELMGIIYQVKDDQLSLYGDQNQTGKPVGTDIVRANKTLYYLYLYKLSSPEEKKLLNQIFGKSPLLESEIDYVQNLIKSLSIDEKINKLVEDLNTQINLILNKLNLPKLFKKDLIQLIKLVQNRNQ